MLSPCKRQARLLVLITSAAPLRRTSPTSSLAALNASGYSTRHLRGRFPTWDHHISLWAQRESHAVLPRRLLAAYCKNALHFESAVLFDMICAACVTSRVWRAIACSAARPRPTRAPVIPHNPRRRGTAIVVLVHIATISGQRCWPLRADTRRIPRWVVEGAHVRLPRPPVGFTLSPFGWAKAPVCSSEDAPLDLCRRGRDSEPIPRPRGPQSRTGAPALCERHAWCSTKPSPNRPRRFLIRACRAHRRARVRLPCVRILGRTCPNRPASIL
ncbi:hypothetical protein OBBRIDRAFT_428953 [Obba rivulosa]|uniref:Uncharacterized protein n=1 Tax=Obba rivulosa TaxID=1052685 RepID=A0A8E2AXV8_9APHY|nr:hypothetical protein OBBRIDRAFT_428953 [Obba rivulosa]